MQWVGRALSSVSQYYKEINPATLSGAIDVIVVEHEDGKDGDVTLACSPFHVRFGKLSVLRPTDRTVYVKINDIDSPFHMKVGDTGEAFFVFETDQDVPADMQTSPITGPVADEDEQEEPDDLELGESVANLQLNTASSQTETDSTRTDPVLQEEVEKQHISKTSRLLEGAVSRLQDTGKGFVDAATLTNKIAGVPARVSSHLPRHDNEDDNVAHKDSELHKLQKKNAITEEAFVASEYAGRATPGSGSVSPKPFGHGVAGNSDDEEEEQPPKSAVSQASGHEKELTKSSYHSSGDYTPPHPLSESIQHELMLDMAGYKTQGPDDREGDGLKTPPDMSAELRERLGEGKARELHERDPDVFALTRALLRYSESKEAQQKNQQRQSLQAVATDPTASFSDITKAASDPRMFVLLSEGNDYIFEISICEDVSTKSGALPMQADFDAHRVTDEQFMKQPELLQDTHLFVRFRDRYFGWENGHPILATLDLYRKALLEAQPKQAATASKGTWSRWWGRGQARGRTTTEGSVSTGPSDNDTEKDSHPRQPTTEVSKKTSRDVTRSSTLPYPSSSPPPLVSNSSAPQVQTTNSSSQEEVPQTDTATAGSAVTQQKHYAKTLRLTSDQLKTLNLKKGVNNVSFTVQSSFSGVAVITARIFLWRSDYQIVISDIDGTITKSDALGHVFTMIGRDWTHPGVANLYTDIARNGYKMLYLTSRAIGQADITREYLRGVQQNGFTLPEGPVIMSPDRLFTSLHREVVLRKPEAFKMACLRDIKRLFSDRNPFYAGFGNRLTDGLSYRHVEIPSSRIFTIDSYGNVKLELLELAGYSSTYIAMANLVDETFPPVNRSSQPAFNDFNYWRPALPNIELPDLTPQPVSPALSARSDSSRMSVFRVGALAGALSKRSSRAQLQNTTGGGDGNRSPLSTSPRSISPSPLHTVFDPSSDDDGGQSRNQSGSQAAKRYRADSMPGSYDDESPLEALRNSLEFGQAESMRRQGSRDSEDGNEDYGSEGDDDDDETRENTLDDDDLPDIDFGSVPYL